MMQQTFLVEIGTDELPPNDLRLLARSFAENFKHQLEQADLQYGEVLWYGSPRRLALKVTDLATYQADHEVKKRGPAISQAFDARGNPTKAAKSWASSCGITVEQAERLVTDKGVWLFYRATSKGRAVKYLLVDMVSSALNQLPIQKLMRWGDKQTQFVRPVHTLIMLLGDQLLEGEVLGVQSSRMIRGHQFMGEAKLTIDSAEQYPARLRERGKVIADYEERKALIKHEANKIARQLGGIVELSDNLLEEVNSLVEWPVVLTAKFEQKFLSVPVEALVHTMKDDQKYFPIYDQVGNLMTNFIFVANIESFEPQQIIAGNEKVIRSRLADAKFFFKTDCKKSLEEYLPRLETVLFQKQLGTLRDKTDRLEVLVGWIAAKIGADVNHATRAGLLSKCDLMTNMVFEFTDTRGIMGMYYARRDGEAEDVAVAIKEQYNPRFSGDKLPSNNVAIALALADKIDTLVGIWGIGQPPKGDKDPFALRRAALGVLRIIVEKSYKLDLLTLTQQTAKLYGNKLTNKNVINDVVKFMLGRFRAWYQEQGYCIDTIQSVLARRPTKPADFDARVKAVEYFRTLSEAKALVVANKRVTNILNKSDEKLNDNVTTTILKSPEEVTLATHMVILQNKLAPLFADWQYQRSLIELASLSDIIDAFFKNVMVMDVDPAVRINRLTLLKKVRDLFLQVADISLLQ
ncbi:glycine--tRNA ligase subunit beta [Arsenophonus endosymbiont of Aleurodicus dispersus]|uniref:glycine--tRNA ligase subunit beta n=1 Tax=Arsenophonus endosymbiont of Aleurodicus dispersus TaxID=235559 RepID=UPI000EAEA601|nr:glycine--tRNA ligase subunit beta [Arsenophonus endosymbiont of Aleurodicus dispersus]